MTLKVFCGANGIRTSDTRIFSPMLYQLSYGTKRQTSKNATHLPPLIKTSFPRLRVQRYNKFLKPPNKIVFFLKIIVNCQLSTVNYQCSMLNVNRNLSINSCTTCHWLSGSWQCPCPPTMLHPMRSAMSQQYPSVQE